MVFDPPILILDSCVLINLFASGKQDSVLSLPDWTFAVCQQVEEECRNLRLEDEQKADHVSLVDLMEAGQIRRWELESQLEFETFLRFALIVDEGEAATIALAVSRGGVVATDDKKAISLLKGEGIGHLSTLQLIKQWSVEQEVSNEALEEVKERLERLGRYRPGSHDPLFDWWQNG